MKNKFVNSPVIPVLTFENEKEALKVSEILISEGLTNLEITLRTPNATNCIKAVIKEFKDANVGAGTVISKEQLKQVKDIGCNFAVSPGFTKELVTTATELNLFYLPGASTPSEMISLHELGIKFQKFFHAGNFGGLKMLKAYSNIFPDIKFCPTGGVGENDFKDYLNLNNVLCVGGSWMVNSTLLNFSQIKHSAAKITQSLRT